jgi:CDP-2,3-bis-(O-geranylgeranyl)-sn-glycerol synthase
MQPLLILQLLFLLMIANGTPIIAKRIFGSYLSWPLDGGVSFFDGQPLFGRSKTIRGVFAAIMVTTAVAPLVGLNFSIGATIAAIAMFGDLLSSFTKRRLRLAVSSKALGLDQVPESLLPLLVCRNALSLSVVDIAICVIAFFVGEIVLSRILYRLHVRDRPY